MKKEELDLLITSQFQQLDPQAESGLTKALESSAQLQEEQRRLQRLCHSLGAFTPPPDPDFLQAVISRLPDWRMRLVRMFPGVVAACLLLLILVGAGIYLSEGSLDGNALLGWQYITPAEAGFVLGN